ATAGACNAPVSYAAPTTTGTCGTVTCAPVSGSSFNVGVTTVTCSTGAGPLCTFTVTVKDTQAPVIGACPSPVTVNNTPGQCSGTATFTPPTATDNCGTPTVTCAPPSGATFNLGVTTVTCTASDSSPDSPDSTCTFTATVKDTQAPTIGACPSTVTVDAASGQCTATATYTAPTATDNCGSATVNCSPASGATFNVGVTTVTCMASDLSPDSPDSTCTFTVTVKDTQAPTIGACPSPLMVNAASGQCAVTVTYTAPMASDNCGSATVNCAPASGSSFNVGVTTVTCTASDT